MAKIETKIGKDVIESLTLGMYEDARFIYREYIQNSADQIDEAVRNNLIDSHRDGRIEIQINHETESISIYDNATGIKANKVQPILKNIAKSTKDRTKNKGFRGIGRLGGLGYCDKLIFETSYKGEASKSYLVWDAKKLKIIINNRTQKEDAASVIDDVTEYRKDKEKADVHYFKVTLEGVSNVDLLDKEKIYEYLSMVAPVSYNKGFIFKNKIYEKAKELDCHIDEYPIFVNKNQIYKPYTTSIYEGDKTDKKKIDEIHDIETFELRTSKNALLAWGWIGISSFTKVMPVVNTARCIRLRKGNIQIGLEDAMTKLFKEERGTKYFFGEIHVMNVDLIPNARRDYFLENQELKGFETMCKTKFEELHKLYYFSSKVRNEKKKIDDFVSFTKEYNEKSTNGGFSDDKEKKAYQEKLETKKEKAEKAEKELEKAKEKVTNSPKAQKKVFDKVVGKKQAEVDKVIIVEDGGKTKYITDDITKLSKKDRKLVSRIFGVIDNVLPKDLSNILKEKIKEELQ